MSCINSSKQTDTKICVRVIYYEVLPQETIRGMEGEGKRKIGEPDKGRLSRVQYFGAVSVHKERRRLRSAGELER